MPPAGADGPGRDQEDGRGEIVVLVDTVTSKENVTRAAISAGWTVKDVKNEGPEFRISIARE